jgi:hypothetical protein
MAISRAELAASSDAVDRSTYTTASFAPTNGRLVIAAVRNSKATEGDTPTLSGGGVTTWTQLATVTTGGVSGASRLTIFHAREATYGASAAVSIAFGGVTQTSCAWIICELDGTDVSGSNGAGAFIQTVLGTAASTATPSVTLSAFADATNNWTLAWFIARVNVTWTPDASPSGYVEPVIEQRTSAPVATLAGEYLVGEDTTVTCTFNGTGDAVGIAMEIKMLVAGGGARPILVGGRLIGAGLLRQGLVH